MDHVFGLCLQLYTIKSHIKTRKKPLLSNMEDCEISVWLS